MVSDDKFTGAAVGGRSARACDNCIKKRARWYCAADDAFLCQSCDSSVHSANSLVRRHERVRLRTTSGSCVKDESKVRLQISVPSWHQGFTRKARTPRKKKRSPGNMKFNPTTIDNNFLHLVPEMGNEFKQTYEELDEEQLLYRVPVIDPFAADFCNSKKDAISADIKGFGYKFKATSSGEEMKGLQRFLPCEMDAEELKVDVESLLGRGLEDELPLGIEGLGIRMNYDDDENNKVKIEEEESGGVAANNQVDVKLVRKETVELNLDKDSTVPYEAEDDDKAPTAVERCKNHSDKTFLRLDHESVLSAWDPQKSPWTIGQRPAGLNSGDWLPDISPRTIGGLMNAYGEAGVMSGHGTAAAAERREARVSRYREKRRTRLFAKKIRYEVRKLNAEKRPRMKGRFVKRAEASFH